MEDLLKNSINDFSIEQVRVFWDQVSDVYEFTNQQFGSTHLQRFEESMKHLDLKSNQKILNIWSRTGLAIPYLRRKCPDVDIVNLEVSPRLIEIARKKFPQEKFQETDLEKLPFGDNCFDYVLSLETLEHAPRPVSFLEELNRVIKPNGFLVMCLPPATVEFPLKIFECFFANHGEGPHKFLSSKKVKKFLRTVGFEVILHKGTLLIPIGPNWLKMLGEKIIDKLQKTPIRELGIRQFYICKKT